MSLRVFHLIFIAVSIALSAGVGVWGVREYVRAGVVPHLLIGVGFFVAGGVLIWYSTWFVRKLDVLRES